MDYQIVFSPECNINPEAFLAAWNDAADCRVTALAERLNYPQWVTRPSAYLQFPKCM